VRSSSGGAAKGIAAKGIGKKQIEIPPAEKLGFFVHSRQPADGKFGLVESCEHFNQMLDDLSHFSQGNPSLNNFSLHGMYIEQSPSIDKALNQSYSEGRARRRLSKNCLPGET